jgi:hypothetical protein
MSNTLQGTRLHYQDGEPDFVWRISETPGAYGSANGKDWFCTTPNGMLGNLGSHQVQEHEDGTITVSPSWSAVRPAKAGTASWSAASGANADAAHLLMLPAVARRHRDGLRRPALDVRDAPHVRAAGAAR